MECVREVTGKHPCDKRRWYEKGTTSHIFLGIWARSLPSFPNFRSLLLPPLHPLHHLPPPPPLLVSVWVMVNMKRLKKRMGCGWMMRGKEMRLSWEGWGEMTSFLFLFSIDPTTLFHSVYHIILCTLYWFMSCIPHYFELCWPFGASLEFFFFHCQNHHILRLWTQLEQGMPPSTSERTSISSPYTMKNKI